MRWDGIRQFEYVAEEIRRERKSFWRAELHELQRIKEVIVDKWRAKW